MTEEQRDAMEAEQHMRESIAALADGDEEAAFREAYMARVHVSRMLDALLRNRAQWIQY